MRVCVDWCATEVGAAEAVGVEAGEVTETRVGIAVSVRGEPLASSRLDKPAGASVTDEAGSGTRGAEVACGELDGPYNTISRSAAGAVVEQRSTRMRTKRADVPSDSGFHEVPSSEALKVKA